MNRETRRAIAKAEGKKVRRPRFVSKSRRPLLHEVNMVFAPIDGFMRQLECGEVYATSKGVIIYQDHEGECYEAIPAVRGFVEVMQKSFLHYGLELDFDPIIKLANRLEASMPITPEHVNQGKEIIQKCRDAYRKMDCTVVGSIVKTIQIRIKINEQRKRESRGQNPKNEQAPAVMR